MQFVGALTSDDGNGRIRLTERRFSKPLSNYLKEDVEWNSMDVLLSISTVCQDPQDGEEEGVVCRAIDRGYVMNTGLMDRLMVPEHYKDRRAEGETVLRQCQLVQLHLLHVVDKICKEEGIPYFLVGGTLLGAMRHNGFIPWDDDLDIGVPYTEYKRFLHAMRNFLPSDACLQTPKECPNTAMPFAKVRDVGSFYCECRSDVSTSAPSGIYIDVFPYEDIPEIGRSMQLFLVKAIGSSWMRTIWFRNMACKGFWLGVPCLIMSGILSTVHGLMRAGLWLLKKVFPSKCVYNVCELGLPYRFVRSDIYPLRKHVFEDGEFPIPNNADGVLTAQYGDWRVVPPPEKREWHARIIDPFRAA